MGSRLRALNHEAFRASGCSGLGLSAEEPHTSCQGCGPVVCLGVLEGSARFM